VLEFAVLGLLHEAPMHGYELRKRLAALLGTFRAFSFGSLYPALRRLQRAGLIVEAEGLPAPQGGKPVPTRQQGGRHGAAGRNGAAERAKGWGRRGRRVYQLTAEGKERFTELLAESGPQTWEDNAFEVHLAFFSRTPAEVRMRILEGRRRRVEERREGLRAALARAGEQIDRYTRELQRMGLETSEREVRWLNELIAHEKAEHRSGATSAKPSHGDRQGEADHE
jgi:DNA-binding PadR family transcriptional regulator